MSCPFCENSDIQARIVHKDALVMAFPTNIPITPGHLLVCPTRHVSKVDDLSNEELKALVAFVVTIKNTIRKALGAEGFNVAWNEGEIAGQSVPHLHIHVVPRKTGDTGILEYEPRKFLYRSGSREASPETELQAVAKTLKEALS